MAPISDPIVRRRMRAAEELLESAKVLLPRHGRIAVYLSGLSVECALKSLVLSQIAATKRRDLDEGPEFRGQLGHSFANLRRIYRRESGGRDVPSNWARDLRLLESIWQVEMRYDPKLFRASDALPLWNSAARLVIGIRSQIS